MIDMYPLSTYFGIIQSFTHVTWLGDDLCHPWSSTPAAQELLFQTKAAFSAEIGVFFQFFFRNHWRVWAAEASENLFLGF